MYKKTQRICLTSLGAYQSAYVNTELIALNIFLTSVRNALYRDGSKESVWRID